MKRIFERIGEVVSRNLRQLCDSMSPKTRLVVVGVMTTIFTIVAIYHFVDSIFGQEPIQVDIINIVDYGTKPE